MNFQKFPLFFFLILIINTESRAQKKISLREAIGIALSNNLAIQKSKTYEGLAELDIKQSKASFYPNLNLSNNNTLSFGRSLNPTTYTYTTQKSLFSSESLTSSLYIFQGFQKVNLLKKNQLSLDENKSNTDKVKNQLVINVVSTFLSVLNFKDELIESRDQLKNAQEQLDFEEKNYKIGKKAPVDVSRASLQVSKIQFDITTIESQLTTSLLDLKQQINVPPESDIDVSELLDTVVLEHQMDIKPLIDYSRKNFPEIKSLEYEKLIQIQNIKIAKANFAPSLSFSGSMTSNYSNVPIQGFFQETSADPFFRQFKSNLYEYLGLTLNIPLYNNQIYRTAVNKAKINLEAAKIDEDLAEQALYKEIKQALVEYRAATKAYEFLKTSVATAAVIFDLIKRKYTNGLASSLDYSQAETDYNQARLKFIHGKYDLIYKGKLLDYYEGNAISY